MKIRKKINFLKVLILFVTLLSLVGCSGIGFNSFDTNKIMKAPEASEKFGEFRKLIEKNEGRDIFLVLPSTQTDNNNAAVKVKDDRLAMVSFNYDGEACGCVAVLKKEQNQWKLVNILKKLSCSVVYMNFADFNNNGETNIVVSWGNNGLRKSAIDVYDSGCVLIDEISRNDGSLYKDFALCDINGDDKLELVAFYSRPNKGKDKNPGAEVYSLNKKFIQISSCEMHDYATYFAISVGFIDDSHIGIFLDGDYLESQEIFCTDAVFWKDGKLENISDDAFKLSWRPINEKSKDVDGDKIIEFPHVEELNFELGEGKNPGIPVIWKKWDIGNDKSIAVKDKSYIYNNYARYAIMMPDGWFDSNENSIVASIIDNSEKSMLFITKQKSNLFEIKIFPKDKWREEKSSEYQKITTKYKWWKEKPGEYHKITTKDNLVYTVRYLSDNDLNIELDDLKSKFVFL